MRSLVRALFSEYRIETTVEKAKEARRMAERLITLCKRASISDIRAIDRVFQDRALTKKLTQVVGPLYKAKTSGYTRIMRTGFRKGDGASMAILELIQKPVVEKKPKRPKKEKPAVPAEKEGRPKEEQAPVKEAPVAEKERPIKKAPPEKAVLSPEPETKPKEPKEVKPREEKAPPAKKGIFGKFKNLFKKDTGK